MLKWQRVRTLFTATSGFKMPNLITKFESVKTVCIVWRIPFCKQRAYPSVPWPEIALEFINWGKRFRFILQRRVLLAQRITLIFTVKKIGRRWMRIFTRKKMTCWTPNTAILRTRQFIFWRGIMRREKDSLTKQMTWPAHPPVNRGFGKQSKKYLLITAQRMIWTQAVKVFFCPNSDSVKVSAQFIPRILQPIWIPNSSQRGNPQF